MDSNTTLRTPLLAADHDEEARIGLILSSSKVAPIDTSLDGISSTNPDGGDGGEMVSEFTKLISKVGNGITPWGRPIVLFDDSENEVGEDLIMFHSQQQQQHNLRQPLLDDAQMSRARRIRQQLLQHQTKIRQRSNSTNNGFELILQQNPTSNNNIPTSEAVIDRHRLYQSLQDSYQRDVVVIICNNNKRDNNTTLYWIITTAATLCLLHIGYVVWGCFIMSESWIDTTISLSFNGGSLSSLLSSLSTTINTVTFDSLVHNLNTTTIDSESSLVGTILWITTLALPFIFLIISPSWLLYDYGTYHNIPDPGLLIIPTYWYDSFTELKPRRIVEVCFRLTFIVLFVFILWGCILNQITVQTGGAGVTQLGGESGGTDTTIITTSVIFQSGFTNYLTGIVCALGMIVVLRLPVILLNYDRTIKRTKPSSTTQSTTVTPPPRTITDEANSTDSNNNYENDDTMNRSMCSIPPPHAFQLPWTEPITTDNEKEVDDGTTKDEATTTTTAVNHGSQVDLLSGTCLLGPSTEDDVQQHQPDTSMDTPNLSSILPNNSISSPVPSPPESPISSPSRQRDFTAADHHDDDEEQQQHRVDEIHQERNEYNEAVPYRFEKVLVPILSYRQFFIIYQILFLSLLFIFPVAYLPWFRIRYYGILSNLLNESDIVVHRIWNIPSLLVSSLWTKEQLSEQPLQIYWITIVIGLFVLVVPIITQSLAVLVWIVRNFVNQSIWCQGVWKQSRNWLYVLHPVANGGLIFAIALLFTLYTLEPLSTIDYHSSGNIRIDDDEHSIWILDNHSKVCQAITAATDESCLVVQGSLLLGGWFYLLHGLLSEILIILTLQWN